MNHRPPGVVGYIAPNWYKFGRFRFTYWWNSVTDEWVRSSREKEEVEHAINETRRHDEKRAEEARAREARLNYFETGSDFS